MTRCIAYRDDGHICGRPAMHLDPGRGGMVCAACAAVPSLAAARAEAAIRKLTADLWAVQESGSRDQEPAE